MLNCAAELTEHEVLKERNLFSVSDWGVVKEILFSDIKEDQTIKINDVDSSNMAQLKVTTYYHTTFDLDDQHVERFLYDWSCQNPLCYETGCTCCWHDYNWRSAGAWRLKSGGGIDGKLSYTYKVLTKVVSVTKCYVTSVKFNAFQICT